MIDINNTTNVDLLKFKSDNLKNINTKNLEDEGLRKVSNEFESFFMQQLMDISLKSTDIAGKSPGSDIIKGMKLHKGKLGLALGSPYEVTAEMIENYEVEGVEVMRNIANLANIKKVQLSDAVQAGEKLEQ